MLKYAILLCLLGSAPGLAQDSHIFEINKHGWYVYSGDHPIAGRWGFHFDGQWRRSEIVTQWQQLLLRPGVNYSLSPNVMLTFGYAFVRTYPYGEFPAPAAYNENRIFEQILFRPSYKRIRLSHRFRLEQRWVAYPQNPDGEYTYQNRFRYQVKVDYPFHWGGRQTRWYLAMFDEIFFGIPPNIGARSFDQNRFFLGLGRSLGQTAAIEFGYLNQFLAERNGRIFEVNNTLYINLISTYPLSRLWK